uniref:Ig-like domain-containing protein n=1 Tax=Pelusios castaneus TaxID=367368 RepID=A0A8C8SQW7_9SAUR
MLLTWVSVISMLWILGRAKGESVIQPDRVTVSQGEPVLLKWDPVRLNCTYEFSVPPSLFWYVQDPNQPLRLLLRDLGRQDLVEEIVQGFNATHDKKEKSFHLWKPSSDLSDSATYYCAASDTVTGSSRRAEQKPLKSHESPR